MELRRGARGAQPGVRRGGRLVPSGVRDETARRGGDDHREEGPEPRDVASLPAVGASGLARGSGRVRGLMGSHRARRAGARAGSPCVALV